MSHKVLAVVFSFLLLGWPRVANAQEQTQSQGPPTPQNTPVSAAAAQVRPEDLPAKYVQFWNTGDPALAKLFDFFIMHSHGTRAVVDSAKLKRVVDSWRKSMPDLKFEVADTMTQPDKVMMRLTFTGTYKERLFANTLDPSLFDRAHTIRSTEILIFAMKDGKIREIWEEYDEEAMRHQMGGVWRTNEELDAKAKREQAQPRKPVTKP